MEAEVSWSVIQVRKVSSFRGVARLGCRSQVSSEHIDRLLTKATSRAAAVLNNIVIESVVLFTRLATRRRRKWTFTFRRTFRQANPEPRSFLSTSCVNRKKLAACFYLLSV